MSDGVNIPGEKHLTNNDTTWPAPLHKELLNVISQSQVAQSKLGRLVDCFCHQSKGGKNIWLKKFEFPL
jgi:hypothetical protein